MMTMMVLPVKVISTGVFIIEIELFMLSYPPSTLIIIAGASVDVAST